MTDITITTNPPVKKETKINVTLLEPHPSQTGIAKATGSDCFTFNKNEFEMFTKRDGKTKQGKVPCKNSLLPL